MNYKFPKEVPVETVVFVMEWSVNLAEEDEWLLAVVTSELFRGGQTLEGKPRWPSTNLNKGKIFHESFKKVRVRGTSPSTVYT